METKRVFFLFMTLFTPICLTVLGLPLPQDVLSAVESKSGEQVVLEDEYVGDNYVDGSWISSEEKDEYTNTHDNTEEFEADSFEKALIGPKYDVIPSKGDITTTPPPITTTPAPTHPFPLFRPLILPTGGFLGVFVNLMIAVIYLLISLGICIAICVMLVVSAHFFDQWRVPVPRNTPPVPRINRPSPRPTQVREQRGRSKSSPVQITVRGEVGYRPLPNEQ